jgi:hypothetical protein
MSRTERFMVTLMAVCLMAVLVRDVSAKVPQGTHNPVHTNDVTMVAELCNTGYRVVGVYYKPEKLKGYAIKDGSGNFSYSFSVEGEPYYVLQKSLKL